MHKTVVRYMCPVCFGTILGDVGEEIFCACGKVMEAVSASVLDSWRAEGLLHKERVRSCLLRKAI